MGGDVIAGSIFLTYSEESVSMMSICIKILLVRYPTSRMW